MGFYLFGKKKPKVKVEDVVADTKTLKVIRRPGGPSSRRLPAAKSHGRRPPTRKARNATVASESPPQDATKAQEEAVVVNSETAHVWVDEKAVNPQYCGICKKFIWGSNCKAYRCRICKILVHQHCSTANMGGCQGNKAEKNEKEKEILMMPCIYAPYLDDLKLSIRGIKKTDTVLHLGKLIAADKEFKSRNGTLDGYGLFLVLSESTGRGLWLADTVTLASYAIAPTDIIMLKKRQMHSIVKVLIVPHFTTRSYRYTDIMRVNDLLKLVLEKDPVAYAELYGFYRGDSLDCLDLNQRLIDFGFEGIETLELRPKPFEDSAIELIDVFIPSIPRRALLPIDDPSVMTVSNVITKLLAIHVGKDADPAKWQLWSKNPLEIHATLDSLEYSEEALGVVWDFGGKNEPRLWLKEVETIEVLSDQKVRKSSIFTKFFKDDRSEEEKKREKEEKKKQKEKRDTDDTPTEAKPRKPSIFAKFFKDDRADEEKRDTKKKTEVEEIEEGQKQKESESEDFPKILAPPILDGPSTFTDKLVSQVKKTNDAEKGVIVEEIEEKPVDLLSELLESEEFAHITAAPSTKSKAQTVIEHIDKKEEEESQKNDIDDEFDAMQADMDSLMMSLAESPYEPPTAQSRLMIIE